MLRIAHCLDSGLTDGGKVVSPTHRPRFTPQKHYYYYYYFALNIIILMFLVLISVIG
jgi:hypothetical protein